jgi:hypothetical protein
MGSGSHGEKRLGRLRWRLSGWPRCLREAPDPSNRPIKRKEIQESMNRFQISNTIYITPRRGREKAGRQSKSLLKSSQFSQSIAGVSMRLKPGGIRELHTTVVNPNGEYHPSPQQEPGTPARSLRHDRLRANSPWQPWGDSAPGRSMAIRGMGAAVSAR